MTIQSPTLFYVFRWPDQDTEIYDPVIGPIIQSSSLGPLWAYDLRTGIRSSTQGIELGGHWAIYSLSSAEFGTLSAHAYAAFFFSVPDGVVFSNLDLALVKAMMIQNVANSVFLGQFTTINIQPPPVTPVDVDLVGDFGGSLSKWNQFYQSTFGNMLHNSAFTKGPSDDTTVYPFPSGWCNEDASYILDAGVDSAGGNNATQLFDGPRVFGYDSHSRMLGFSADQTYSDFDHYCDFKDVNAGFACFSSDSISGSPSNWQVIYNLSNGAVVSTAVSGTATITSAPPMTDLGNGWWRAKVTASAHQNTLFVFRARVSNGNATYVGDGSKSILVFRPKMMVAGITEHDNALVTLHIPGGNFGGTSGGNILASAKTMGQRCILQGAGIGVSLMKIGSHFGVYGQSPGIYTQARFQTALAGSSSISLVNVADHVRFAVGRYVFLVGVDMQGFGYPCNNRFQNFRKITNVDRTNGIIAFDTPLSQNFKSTYPLWNDGDSSNADQGGSATIMPLTDGYDQDVTVNDISITNLDNGSEDAFGGASKTVAFNRVEWQGFSYDPSENVDCTLTDCLLENKEIEIDKSVKNLTYNTSNIHILHNQSGGSNENLNVNNCIVNQMTGMPINTVINGGTMNSLFIGAQSYGISNTLLISNHVCASATAVAARGCSNHAEILTINTSGTGLLTLVKPRGGQHDQINDLVVGGYYSLVTSSFVGPVFTITDMWEDPSNTYYQTSLSGTVPQIASSAITVNGIGVHPCPRLQVTNSSGCQFYTSYSGKGLCSFGELFDSGVVDPSNFPIDSTDVFGTFVSARMRVTKPYTGAVSGLQLAMAEFGFELFPNHLISPVDNRWGKSWSLTSVYDSTLLATDVGGPGANQFMKQQQVALHKIFDGGGTNVLSTVLAEGPSKWPIFQLQMTLSQGIV